MRESFELKTNLDCLPVLIQGVFKDGELEGIRTTTNGEPLSFLMPDNTQQRLIDKITEAYQERTKR